MRRACIDIGSNTTRLLVAECRGEQLLEVHQERAFTRVGRDVQQGGPIGFAKIAEVVEVVCAQLRSAHQLGASDVHGVATAAIRRAANRATLIAAIRSSCGLNITILSGEAEARLAFLGAALTLDRPPAGTLGVVDVGGGSSELVVGTAPDHVSWCTSFAVGSGDLAEDYLRSDPPSAAELSAAREHLGRALEDVEAPHPAEALAVGGSATSLQRLAGPLLDTTAFARTLGLLGSERAGDIARRFALDVERVRLLPAGLLILQAASKLFGLPLRIGHGGVREGVLLAAGR